MVLIAVILMLDLFKNEKWLERFWAKIIHADIQNKGCLEEKIKYPNNTKIFTLSGLNRISIFYEKRNK